MMRRRRAGPVLNRDFEGWGRTARTLCLLCVAVAAFSSRAAAETLEEWVRGCAARHKLPASELGVVVLLESSSPIVALQADKPLKPASNQKLLTTAAGVKLLGPDHAFVTTLRATAPLREGRIAGDVVVRGTGDPNISARFYDDDPTAIFRSWARQLRKAGLVEITGDLIADDTYFDDVRVPPSWNPSQYSGWYSAQVSALNLNDNCLDFTVTPASRTGLSAKVTWVPTWAGLKVEGAPKTVSEGETSVILHRKTGTNVIAVSGRICRKTHEVWRGNVTFDDPALVFVTVLASILRQEGIQVQGRPRRVSGPDEAARLAQAGRSLLVRHTSSLGTDLPIINKNSQNLHAEALLKVLGAEHGGAGSVEGGARAVQRFLRDEGIPAPGLSIHDGSGLSHENRVSAGTMGRVLHAARGEPYFALFLESLSVAGVDGTLKRRFDRHRALHGKVRAKTGYIDGVSCLSGYVTRGDRTACFSILCNGLRSPVGEAKAFQEEVVERVYRTLGGP